MNYESNNMMMLSDHKPVFGQFELDLTDLNYQVKEFKEQEQVAKVMKRVLM